MPADRVLSSSGYRRANSALAVVVADGAVLADHDVVIGIAGPDPDLVAVGVDGRGRVDHRGEHEDAGGSVGLVADPMSALGATREEDDVPGVELLGSLRVAQRRRP